jgi:hypothetical protein
VSFHRRPDLSNRAIPVELPVIDVNKRMSERELWTQFKSAAPGILGAILDLVSGALRHVDEIRAMEGRWPRMADFASFVQAAETYRPWSNVPFLEAFTRVQTAMAQRAVEDDPVSAGLLELTKARRWWRGTATDLLESLAALGLGGSLPGSASALANRLTVLKPALRELGFEIRHQKVGRNRDRLIEITYDPARDGRADDAPIPPSAASSVTEARRDGPETVSGRCGRCAPLLIQRGKRKTKTGRPLRQHLPQSGGWKHRPSRPSYPSGCLTSKKKSRPADTPLAPLARGGANRPPEGFKSG